MHNQFIVEQPLLGAHRIDTLFGLQRIGEILLKCRANQLMLPVARHFTELGVDIRDGAK